MLSQAYSFPDRSFKQWHQNDFETGDTHLPLNITKRKKKIIVPLHFFGFTGATGRFGEHFDDGIVQSYSLLFFYSRCPPCLSAISEFGAGGTCPIESAPLVSSFIDGINYYVVRRTFNKKLQYSSDASITLKLDEKIQPRWHI